jgi:hypothetical protein
VDTDHAKNPRLVLGKLDGKSMLAARLVDSRGEPLSSFEIYQDGPQVRVSGSSLADFQIHLPWARRAVEIERGSAVATDPRAPMTTAGIVVRSSGGTASFRYEA